MSRKPTRAELEHAISKLEHEAQTSRDVLREVIREHAPDAVSAATVNRNDRKAPRWTFRLYGTRKALGGVVAICKTGGDYHPLGDTEVVSLSDLAAHTGAPEFLGSLMEGQADEYALRLCIRASVSVLLAHRREILEDHRAALAREQPPAI